MDWSKERIGGLAFVTIVVAGAITAVSITSSSADVVTPKSMGCSIVAQKVTVLANGTKHIDVQQGCDIAPVTVVKTVTVTAPPPKAPPSTRPTAVPSTTTTKSAPAGPPPGGGAPTNGAFPDATTTGVPEGTVLKTSGSITVDTAGAVISGLDVNGCVSVNAPNVTIKNSRIRGTCNYVVGSYSSGLLIEDSEVDGLDSAGASVGIGYAGFTALRVDVHGSQDGINANGNVVIKDSYVHDLHATDDSHNDGIQITEGANVAIIHNSILNQLSNVSAIMVGADQGDVSNVSIDGNLLAGGGYTLYGGDKPPAGNSVARIAVTNNQFSTRFFPRSGVGAPFAYVIAGQPFTNNTWADGPNKGQAI